MELLMMGLTLREYRLNLGWSQNRLAKEADLTGQAVRNAEVGRVIRPDTAKAIADALARGFGREILVLDIEGLNIM
jgi:DNA-binding XRE family transcriptional regulator